MKQNPIHMYSHKIFLVGVLCALMMQNIVACGLADALLETAYDPQVSLSQKPDRYTQASEARFQFRCNQANCTFYCLHVQSPLFDEYEAEDLKKCNSEMAIPGLSEGEHQMLVYAQDAGDRRNEILEFIWSVDQTPPITSFASDFTTYVNTATRGLEFSCVDASPCSFNCQLENGPTSKCSSPLVLTDLTKAARLQLRIQAQDAAGNLEEVTPAQIKTIIVDNSKPVLELTDYPGKNSNEQDNRTRISVSFRTLDRGNAGPETFECQLNNEAILSNCTSPWEPTLSITSSAAQELSQTLKIRAIDGASNIGDWEQVSWVFDQIAPTVILVDQPSIVSTDRNPVFQFACTDEDCQYTCSLDGENQTLCGPPFGGPIHPIPSIALGSHGLTVTAVDLAGNRSDPIQFDWTVVSRWSEIESSGFHSCGITVDQELFC